VTNRNPIIGYILLAALVTTGLATLFFWLAWVQTRPTDDTPEEAQTTIIATEAPVEQSPSATVTVTLTSTITPTPTNTPTRAATETPTVTPSLTSTDTPTATNTPSPTHTLTHTATPYPVPEVNPIALAETYAGEPISISGQAQPEDTITLLDNGEMLISVPADSNGDWEINLDDGLMAGGHLLELFVTSPTGVESAIIPLGFIVNVAPTDTPTSTPTATHTHTHTATATDTPEPTDTNTPRPSNTATEVAQQITIAPSDELIDISETPSFTPSVTITATDMPTQTITITPSITTDLNLLPSSPTFTVTASQTQEPSVTITPTIVILPSDTPSPEPTVTSSLIPPTDIPTEIVQVATETEQPTEIASPTPTALPSSTPTPLPVAPPNIDTPQNPYSPYAPLALTGTGLPNNRVVFTVNGESIGEVVATADGSWQFVWQTPQTSRIEAITVTSQMLASEPTQINVVVESSTPEITSPSTGRTVTPGSTITLVGAAPALAPLTITDQSGTAYQELTTTEDGSWSTSISLVDTGTFDLRVRITDEEETSNIVRINVAESIAPETGAILETADTETNRAYLALFALLFTAAGIGIYIVGRTWQQRENGAS